MKKLAIIGMCFILIIGLVGCNKDSTKKAVNNEKKKVPVTVQTVDVGDISKTFTYAGKLKPIQRVNVISKVPGKVIKVYKELGDKVKKDDVLFELDKKDIENQIKDLNKKLASCEMSINLQKMTLDNAKNSDYEKSLAQLQQGLTTAEITYNDAKKAFEDTEKLYEQGAVSKTQYDNSKSGYEKSKVAYDVSKKNYDLYVNDLSKDNIKVNETKLQQAIVQKEQLELSLQNARDALEDSSVKSPIDGVISNCNVGEGDMLGNTSIPFVVVQDNTVILEVGVSEKVVTKIEVGQKVPVTVSSVSSKPISGEIKAISPAADERTGLFLTKIELNNEDRKLKSGMFAEIAFDVDSDKDVPIIPYDSVLSEDEGDYVYIVDENNCAKKVEVKTGINNGDKIAVISGINKGDQVIIEGQNYAKDDSEVKIIK